MIDLKTWLAPFDIDAQSIEIKNIKVDSRGIVPGDVFVVLQGINQSGAVFIDSALANGAAAVLVDQKDLDVTNASVDSKWKQDKSQADRVIAVTQLTKQLPKLLNAFYPISKHIKKIGITGTNGKTTTSQLIAQLGEQLDEKISLIGTLGVGTLDALLDINSTTPEITDNYRLLEQFWQNGSRLMAMEVSSQGLSQHRVSGIDFDCVVFTNLTQDHLDYHVSLDNYAAAKKALFDTNPQATTILNIDDATARGWLSQWRDTRRIIAVGRYDANFIDLEHVMFKDVRYINNGLAFNLVSSWGNAEIVSPMFGKFNLNNLMSAMAALLSSEAFDIQLTDLAVAVNHIRAIAGRMERFTNETTGGVVAIVDYAHTPDALSQALQALKGHTKGQLWCIFGCGGGRDKSKRPLMAAMAEQHADRIVITNDNPRHESPLQIIGDIQAGLRTQDNVQVEPDRKRAIVQTLAAAKDGDIVLIAGKGHETYQVVGDDVIDYDERSFVRQCFNTKARTGEEMAT